MEKLSHKMQKRLDDFVNKAKEVETKSMKTTNNRNFVPRGDYGDDIRDFEKKDEAAWREQCQSDPLYRNTSWN